MFNRGPRVYGCALLALVSLLCGTARLSSAIDIDKLPKPTGYVSDLAHVLDVNQKQQLEAFCTSVEQQLQVQFALVTIDSLDGQPIRDAALDIGRKWGVGNKANQGVLLLLSIKDRQSDIETGRGIEPYITDGFSGSTLRAMRPDLRSGDYGQALATAAQSMATQIASGKGVAFTGATLPERRPAQSARRGSGIPFPLIIFGIFFLLWLFGRGGGRRGGGGAGNFLTGMFLGNMLGRGGGFGGSGGSWGGGGFGGGSGGGGGFGGFGGGDFGGGGASSNW